MSPPARADRASRITERVTNKTASNRYARALLDVAIHEKADLEAIERDLATFAQLFTDHPGLAKVLLNPAVPVPRKRAAVADLLALVTPSPIVGKLIALLAERDRLVLIPDLLASYSDRLLDYRKVVRAEVTTAVPLPEGHAETIEGRLAQLTGGRVLLSTRTDPSIIGGVVARIGSTVYDGSVTRQLEKMKQRLIESV
jgi:F-type H+-transporting ATPase subunit delta